MRAQLIRDMVGIREKEAGSNRYERFHMPVGLELDSSDCYMLVQLGCAKPLDEECFEACGRMTDDQIAVAAMQYEANDSGIQPGHRALFYSGKITGYDPETGKFKITDQFTAEDAAAFPEDTPDDFEFETDEEGDEDE